MKKIAALILATALMLSFVGCSNTNTADENNSSDPEQGVTIENDEQLTDTQISDETLPTKVDAENDLSACEFLAVSSAVYPEMAPDPYGPLYVEDTEDDDAIYDAYDAWRSDLSARYQFFQDYSGELDSFFTDSMRQFLTDSQGQNKVYSPINVYMALGMLAEVTDGESRNQILDLLGADSVEDLRAQANAIWNANYRNDGATTSIFASSLWLNEDVNFVQSTMDSLAQNYYASSYQGIMGSEELNSALQNWLNEQTGGLLEDKTSGIGLNEDTIMALAATVNFHARWRDEFYEGATYTGTFHGVKGDLECDFMRQNKMCDYYWGENFSAVNQRLANVGTMWLILPDESVSVDELIEDDQAMEFIMAREWEDQKSLMVHMTVPKFDVSSDMDLTSGLKALGVTDVFDPAISDFTPMTTDMDEEIYLSQAQHAARVQIDEEGCTAVAYTVFAVDTTSAEPEELEEIDFVLDRPFLFVITGVEGLPLFAGVVNQPVE